MRAYRFFRFFSFRVLKNDFNRGFRRITYWGYLSDPYRLTAAVAFTRRGVPEPDSVFVFSNRLIIGSIQISVVIDMNTMCFVK